ncbi:hypothetical protein DND132_0925 [Pseudodesulfovibrio mercurii]|uniref:Uncharacterized protein n=1 Tax=Pseudodesulfovibrio mercurii TaxID=641491 RepID=F0JI10_9BACT|nr:hypothetical protein DND132_0925 [Pseudodesulfovibrio mercurii]
MFDHNGREPILSETEIRFLLSDTAVGAKSMPRPTRDKGKGKTKGVQRKRLVEILSAAIREYRQP